MFGVAAEHRPPTDPPARHLGGKPRALVPFHDRQQLWNRVGEVRAYRTTGHGKGVQRSQVGDLLPVQIGGQCPWRAHSRVEDPGLRLRRVLDDDAMLGEAVPKRGAGWCFDRHRPLQCDHSGQSPARMRVVCSERTPPLPDTKARSQSAPGPRRPMRNFLRCRIHVRGHPRIICAMMFS